MRKGESTLENYTLIVSSNPDIEASNPKEAVARHTKDIAYVLNSRGCPRVLILDTQVPLGLGKMNTGIIYMIDAFFQVVYHSDTSWFNFDLEIALLDKNISGKTVQEANSYFKTRMLEMSYRADKKDHGKRLVNYEHKGFMP